MENKQEKAEIKPFLVKVSLFLGSTLFIADFTAVPVRTEVVTTTVKSNLPSNKILSEGPSTFERSTRNKNRYTIVIFTILPFSVGIVCQCPFLVSMFQAHQ